MIDLVNSMTCCCFFLCKLCVLTASCPTSKLLQNCNYHGYVFSVVSDAAKSSFPNLNCRIHGFFRNKIHNEAGFDRHIVNTSVRLPSVLFVHQNKYRLICYLLVSTYKRRCNLHHWGCIQRNLSTMKTVYNGHYLLVPND